LLVVSVQLEVDGHAIPPRRRGWSVGSIDRTGDAVERDRFVLQIVAGGSLKLDREMVPGIAIGFARSTRGNPVSIDVVPDPPHRTVDDLALGSKHQAQIVKN